MATATRGILPESGADSKVVASAALGSSAADGPRRRYPAGDLGDGDRRKVVLASSPGSDRVAAITIDPALPTRVRGAPARTRILEREPLPTASRPSRRTRSRPRRSPQGAPPRRGGSRLTREEQMRPRAWRRDLQQPRRARRRRNRPTARQAPRSTALSRRERGASAAPPWRTQLESRRMRSGTSRRPAHRRGDRGRLPDPPHGETS
jgi:hypothetical protein